VHSTLNEKTLVVLHNLLTSEQLAVPSAKLYRGCHQMVCRG
jgi:hypothetical protein